MSKLREPRSGTRGGARDKGRKPGFRISRAGWATLAAILLSAFIWAAVITAVLFVRHNFVVHGG